MQHLSSLLPRILAVLVVIGVALSLWMWHDSLSSGVMFKFNSWARPNFDSQPTYNISFSDSFFPVIDSPAVSPVIRHNSKVLHDLVTCLEYKNCSQNQTKVIILASGYSRDYLLGSRGGESIWAHSTSVALTNLGHTILYTPYPSLPYAIQFYKTFPDLVKLVFMDERDVVDCYNDQRNCNVSDYNPTGIPPWKTFSFVFWPGSHHPYGPKWTLSPENYSAEGLVRSSFVGYSIEENCQQYTFVPHQERENQAWILAKYLHYFSQEFHPAWSKADFDNATEATSLMFAMGSVVADHPEAKPEFPSNYLNYGRLDQPAFMRHLSMSRVLIGMGDPLISPSPYDALCLGVPFINPIKNWDHDNPKDSSRWETQHNGLRDLGPPYVYNVFKGDTEGFVQALKDALANPIDSYVLPRMTMSAVEERLSAIVETDWRTEADIRNAGR